MISCPGKKRARRSRSTSITKKRASGYARRRVGWHRLIIILLNFRFPFKVFPYRSIEEESDGLRRTILCLMNAPMLTTPAVDSTRPKTKTAGKYQRTYADFNSLERALISDDLHSARHAFARLMEDAPEIAQAVSSDPFPHDSDRLRAFKELGHCLASGDLPGAKFASQQFQE